MTTSTASRIRLLGSTSGVRLVAGGIVALGLLAGCAGPAAPSATSGATAPASPAVSSPEMEPSGPATADAETLALKMETTQLGSILTDGTGMTLYLYTKDSPNTSVCTGQCLTNWPPLLGVPTAGEGVDDSKLGSFKRADGSTQATYNGWPLYYWIRDTAPGDTTGQNVGGVWYMLDRDGNAIKK